MMGPQIEQFITDELIVARVVYQHHNEPLGSLRNQ